ncbi:MAG: class I SAM-dependent methyltransferase [Gemmatimonadetes bacterium]|nr:class I SAM-dependent methyltransferase [Gemmatimonadota bacterium]
MRSKTMQVLKFGKRVYRTAQLLRDTGASRVGLRGSTAELVARQHGPSGYNRMDLVVMYLAIQEARGEGEGKIALLEKLVQRDPARRKADSAILEFLKRDTLSNGLFIPNNLLIDSGMSLVASVAPLAMAVSHGDTEIPVEIRRRHRGQCYDLQWFRTHGFAPVEIEAIEAARTEVFQKLGFLPLPWETRSRIEKELRRFLPEGETLHGRGDFYQTCEELLIGGQRPTALRFRAYNLNSVLKATDRVLDIGCNCGFFALLVSRYVQTVDGFDISPRFISIASAAQRHLGRENCRFTTSSFQNFTVREPYDVIFSFAVHHWIGMPMAEYAARLRQMLKPGGLVLVESQDLGGQDKDWDEKLRALHGAGFAEVRSGTLCDDGRLTRRHVLLRDDRVSS